MNKKVGRPKKYEGEKNVQLSVTIRPRYRQALELIAKSRESTLSEALELAIYELASSFSYNDTAVIDLIRPKDEILKLVYGAISPINFFTYISLQDKKVGDLTLKDLDIQNFKITRAKIDKAVDSHLLYDLENKPEALLSPLESYIIRILNTHVYKEHLYQIKASERLAHSIITFFDKDKIINLIEEAWRLNMPSREIINSILAIELFLSSSNLLTHLYINYLKENNINENMSRDDIAIKKVENYVKKMPLPSFEKVQSEIYSCKESLRLPPYSDITQITDLI